MSKPGDQGSEANSVGPLRLNKPFLTSVLGILKVANMVLSLIAFICVSAGDWYSCPNWSAFRFAEFSSMSTFWSFLVLYFIYVFSLAETLKFIHWTVTELVWSAVMTLFLFISAIVLAAMCCGVAGFVAGTIFHFIATATCAVNTLFIFREFRSGNRYVGEDSQRSASTESNAEEWRV